MFPINIAAGTVEKISLVSTAGLDQWRFRLPSVNEKDFAARLSHCERVLSSEEKNRASRCSNQRRGDFIITRGTVRQILARYADEEPADLQFEYAPYGKPRLVHSNIRFNVAHTDGLALLVVSREQELGVDLERVRPAIWAARIAQHFFAASDAQSIMETTALKRSEIFLRHWTLREALLKAAGTGLSGLSDTRELVFGGDPDPTSFASRRWSLQSVLPAQGYVGAIASTTTKKTIPARSPNQSWM